MESIIHFVVEHKEGPKSLRGLLFLDEGQIPNEAQLLEMFKDMNFDVRMADREKLIFKPVNAGDRFSEIRITSFENSGKNKTKQENDLKSIVGNLLPQKPSGL